VGSASLSAIYSGDSNYESHTVAFTQTVQMAGTTSTLISSPNPSSPGQVITFTAGVTSNTTGKPTGTVTLLDGTTVIGTSALTGGVATFSISTLSVGSHSITASYGGDSNFIASTSAVLSQVVQNGSTSTTVSSSLNPSTINQSAILTAMVSSSLTGTISGIVTFLDGSTTLGSSSLNGSGSATLAISTLAVGTHNITAAYSGDGAFTASTSAVLSQVVQKANTSTTLSSAPASANLNQTVTFTATVTPGTAGEPTGAVNFLDGTTQIGSAALNGAAATFSTSALAAGSHSITAAYSGNDSYNVSASTAMNLVVTAPDFALSTTALSPASVAPGASAKSTITIIPSGGLNSSTVAVGCSVSPVLSPPATCSLTAVSVANNSGTSTLTVATVGPQAALASPTGLQGSGMQLVLGLMIPVMFLSGAGLKKAGQRNLLGLCLVFLVLGGCLLQVACGASGSAPATVGNSGTPAGTYKVTVTGTANGTLTQTTSVSLTVQ
jgi:hypothetical protein